MRDKLNDKRIPNMDLLMDTLRLTVLGAPTENKLSENPEDIYRIAALEIISLMEEIIETECFTDDKEHESFNNFLADKLNKDEVEKFMKVLEGR